MMKRAFASLVLSLLAASLLPPSAANAQWVENGTAVCAAPLTQHNISMIPDGAGGAIVAWEDHRGTDVDIYVQRFDAYGRMLWGAGGVRVGTDAVDDLNAILLADGAGGAILVYYGEPYIRAQRLNAAGGMQWAAGGVRIGSVPDSILAYDAIGDGSGGAIVAWQAARVDSLGIDIVLQGVPASGALPFPEPAIVVCGAEGDQLDPRLAAIGPQDVIVSWTDWRAGIASDIYAQRAANLGFWNEIWAMGGVPVCAAAGNQHAARIVSDGLGGAIAVWNDERGGNEDIYGQRIASNGSMLWTTNGVTVCSAANDQALRDAVADDDGGVLIAWQDARLDANLDIYAQRLDGMGSSKWLPNGAGVSAAAGVQVSPRIAANGLGGAIIVWQDGRLGNDYDIYAQSIDAAGIAQWTLNGISVCDAAEMQLAPAIASDGAGGALFAWSDERSGSGDIYAQRIERAGYWGYPAPAIFAVRDVPGDQGGMINLAWDASRLDPWPYQLILNYSIWRAISPTEAARAIASGEAAEKIPGADIPSIRVEEAAGQVFYWKFISYLYAASFEHYSENVATLFDSTAVCDEMHYFQVVAHPVTGKNFWASAPDSGYSVDNLAPARPCSLAARQTGDAIRIVWAPNCEADLSHYAIYRGLTEDVPLDAPLLCTADTVAIDTGWTAASNSYYYKLVAFDVHGNASPAALLRPGSVVATLLRTFSCSLVDGSVLVEWSLAECDGGASFSIERAAGAEAAFEPLSDAAIVREGLMFRFTDGGCEPEATYRYRVTLEAGGERTVLFETEPVLIPAAAMVLRQNAPNPFNPSTTIRFSLPRDARVTLDVFDVSGRLVARLVDGALAKGSHAIAWNGEDRLGGSASSGVYFYVLRAGKETLTRKMVLLR